jgi:N-acetylglucosamine-6-phosphate deacetylase|tara:strand:- start:3830 stop:4930 length:1101 start_codon:yes stop_codon:yes gene_type:complete
LTLLNFKGQILTPDGWVEGTIQFDKKINSISESGRENSGLIVLPGFVDLHVPGGGGGDVMRGEDDLRLCASLHASHGTTSFLATTITAPEKEIILAAKAIDAVSSNRHKNEARILGVHMEGPYLNSEMLGAQPPFSQSPDLKFIEDLLKCANVKLVTLAPECDPGHILIKELVSRGILVQVGHSNASYEEIKSAIKDGVGGFTHLYNAMSPLHHREPGVVGAALAHGTAAALIPDLIHVKEGAIHAALRSLPDLYFVTDATSAAGMPDGDYTLGRNKVTKRGDGVFFENQILAGSALTMDKAFRNLLSIGIDVKEASRRLSTIPADLIGAKDRGRLEKGASADFVILNEHLDVVEVIVEGSTVFNR